LRAPQSRNHGEPVSVEPAAGQEAAGQEHVPADEPAPAHEYAVRASHERFHGRVFSVVTDEVAMPGGGYAARDYVRHIGAVVVVPLDEQGRVTMVRQYRHPVRAVLWELPAGLVDVAGEEPVHAAARELAEEAQLAAATWYRLADLRSSPGYSDERVQVFLARDLSPVTDHDFQPEHEELDLKVERVDLDRAVQMVFTGEIANAAAAVGVLAAAQARARGFQDLSPAT
jgi:8-oxo-dGDP phosphatase